MDKTLFKAYVRTIVEEEVKKLLPELLSEAVEEIKGSQLNETSTTSSTKPKVDRGKLAELLNVSYDGETLRAGTDGVNRIPEEHIGKDVSPGVKEAINRDYSALMKAMKIT